METKAEVPTEVSPFLVESKADSELKTNTQSQSSWWKIVVLLAVAASVAIVASVTFGAISVRPTHHSNHGSSKVTLSLNKNSEGDTAAYSEEMGNRTFRVSGILNCAKEDIDSGTCDNCHDITGLENITVVHEEDKDLQMLLAFDTIHEQIMIGYRGSEASNYKDYNLDFFWEDYEGDDQYCAEDEDSFYCCGDDCKVHGGFQRAFDDLQAVSWEHITTYIDHYSDYPIMLTGYSLGGALAHFSAMNLVRYLNEIESTQPLTFYSHGSTRIGNADMVAYYEKLMDGSESAFWRVTWLHDPIPKLPPYEIGYRHSGNEVWYYCSDPMNYISCDEGDDDTCSDGYRQGGPIENLADHVYYYKYFNTCPKKWYKKYPTPTMCEDI